MQSLRRIVTESPIRRCRSSPYGGARCAPSLGAACSCACDQEACTDALLNKRTLAGSVEELDFAAWEEVIDQEMAEAAATQAAADELAAAEAAATVCQGMRLTRSCLCLTLASMVLLRTRCTPTCSLL